MLTAIVLQGKIKLHVLLQAMEHLEELHKITKKIMFWFICRLSQTCNHVAAMLFRVDAAVLAGWTNPTCTSQKAEWVVPAPKTVAIVAPISDLEIEVHKYGKESKYSQY